MSLTVFAVSTTLLKNPNLLEAHSSLSSRIWELDEQRGKAALVSMSALGLSTHSPSPEEPCPVCSDGTEINIIPVVFSNGVDMSR
jgi:hypothetical protein